MVSDFRFQYVWTLFWDNHEAACLTPRTVQNKNSFPPKFSNVLPNNFQQEHFAPLFLYTAGTIKKTPQLLRLDNSGYFLKPPHLPHTSCISHHVIKWNPTLSGVLVWSCRLAGNYFPNCCGCRTAAQRKLYKHDLRYIDAICRNLLRSLVGAPAGLDWLSPWHDMHGMSACEIRWRFMVWNFGRKHVVCNIGNSETRKIFDTWVRNYVFLPIQRVWYLEDFAATTDIWMQCASKFVVLANCWPRILVASVLPHPPKKKQKKMRLKWATSGHTNGNWKWKFPRWRKQMKLHIPGASTHADFHVFNLGFKI